MAKGRKCSYLPSKRGGPRKKKQKTSPSPEEESQSDTAQFAVVPSTEFEERMQTPANSMAVHVADGLEAPGMFSQIDVLSIPGAGLRHLDFSHVSSMFQGYYSGDGSSPQVHLDSIPSPLSDSQCWVRTYGSEAEM